MQHEAAFVFGSGEPGSAVWFWAAAATIIATLASAVAMLYKAQIAMKDADITESKSREDVLREEMATTKDSYKLVVEKLEEEVNECRRDREELRVQMARFETRLQMLESHDRSSTEHGGRIDQRLDDLEDRTR